MAAPSVRPQRRHLVTHPAIVWDGSKEIPEGILDAVSR